MFIEGLQRHLSICGQQDLPAKLQTDTDFWSVISIREHFRPRPELRHARRALSLIFDDREDAAAGTPPTAEHLRQAFEYADAEPNAPLLVQCWLGWSRSTAVALALLARGQAKLGADNPRWKLELVEQLLEIRPHAKPNKLVLLLGLAQFLNMEQASQLAADLVKEPRLLANRGITD